MKTVTVKELKTELSHNSNTELIELILHLSKFKKENKELLSYLLFESENEEAYISNIKIEMNDQFEMINTKTYYFIKKGIRKISRWLKVQIRYSKNKETEVQLLLYYCKKMKNFEPSILVYPVINNIYNREIDAVKRKITHLHEDLQYDFNVELETL